jgi:diguanylate cyclase (GGDEF)-like protein
VLLVEDSLTDAMRIHQLLARARAARFIVELAATVDTALRRLAERGIDVVLLDLTLPGCTGLDAYLAILGSAPNHPIVVLGSPHADALGLQAVELGAQDYLVKAQVTAEPLARALRFAVQRQRTVAGLRGLSLTDGLTGLLNRRGFVTMARSQIRLGNRTGSRFLLLYLDLDGLKRINDTHGHHEGDLALMRAAEALRSTFRQSDVVARLGGDEFAVLALDVGADGGAAVLRRLHENLDRLNGSTSGEPARLTLGGITFDASRDTDLTRLLARADAALYAVRRGG